MAPSKPRIARLQLVGAHQLADRGGFAAGDDQAVEAVQLMRLSHLARQYAEAPQHIQVLAEVALYRQDADSKLLAHLSSVDSGFRCTPDWDYCY